MRPGRVRVAPEDRDDVYRAQLAAEWQRVDPEGVAALRRSAAALREQEAEPVYPDDYRKCSQVCRAEMGEKCFSLSGKIVEGQPDSIRTYLDRPHMARRLRVRRKA